VEARPEEQPKEVKEQHGYEGELNHPMSWDRTVEKFHWLSEAFSDEDLRNRLVQVVQQLDAGPMHPCLSGNSSRYPVTVQGGSGRADWSS
jgi:hypothetical protein